MMLGDGPNKYTVAVYQLPDGKGAPVHLFSLEDREVNTLHWSPKGEFLILAGLTSNQGRLEFFDVSTRRTMNVVSHDVANGLVWDPSGRMVATIKTQHVGGAHLTRDTVANGYILWTFQGVKIFEAAKPKLFQFVWRPRAEGLLTDDESKEVTKNLKKYIQKYQHQDKERQERTALLGRLRKLKARDEFRAFLAERSADFEANRPLRIEMGIENEEEPSVVVYEEIVEGLVKEEVSSL
jgi:translation initiation factor 3 subunit B